MAHITAVVTCTLRVHARDAHAYGRCIRRKHKNMPESSKNINYQ